MYCAPWSAVNASVSTVYCSAPMSGDAALVSIPGTAAYAAPRFAAAHPAELWLLVMSSCHWLESDIVASILLITASDGNGESGMNPSTPLGEGVGWVWLYANAIYPPGEIYSLVSAHIQHTGGHGGLSAPH